MTLWVVKGGRGGIREDRFLARSVIGIGWREVGDVNTQAAQLWAFGHRMEIGDPVVVPFLGQPVIAIGEITGPYRWVPDGDPDMPHVREVTWHVTDLPRVAFDSDLRYSFGGSVTVCSVTRNHAERRVCAMIDDLSGHGGPIRFADRSGMDR